MIWLVLGAVVLGFALLMGVALCRSSARGDKYQHMRHDYRDFWQG